MVRHRIQHPSRAPQRSGVPSTLPPTPGNCIAPRHHFAAEQCLQDEPPVHGLPCSPWISGHSGECKGSGVHSHRPRATCKERSGLAVTANPSLERTSTGLALGPRSARCHHPLRGPSAIPVPARSAQTLGISGCRQCTSTAAARPKGPRSHGFESLSLFRSALIIAAHRSTCQPSAARNSGLCNESSLCLCAPPPPVRSRLAACCLTLHSRRQPPA